jgi:hypothetical protein
MAMNAPAGTMVSDLTRFKLAKQGLGKSQFLGMGEITSIVKKKVSEITEEDAVKDGFSHDKRYNPETDYWGYNPEMPKSAADKLIDWLLKHNRNRVDVEGNKIPDLTLDSEVYLIQWRWVE